MGVIAKLELMYGKIVSRLFPVGFAWPREAGSVLGKVSGVLALALARMHARAEALLNERDPRTTLEMLPEWEREWGLPGPCNLGVHSLQERRQVLTAKVASTGGQSRKYYHVIARNLGYEVEITEYRPFMFGLTEMMEPDDDAVKNEILPDTDRLVWDVHVAGPRLTWFRAGESECGVDTMLNVTRADELECQFERMKLAHTELNFIYDF